MQSMNGATHLEHRASSRLSKHEGESSFALCDRLDRTRANSQRQLPTDHDYAVPTREYQTDQSSLKSTQTAARSVIGKRKRKPPHNPTDLAQLTRSLHIRAKRSLSCSTRSVLSASGRKTGFPEKRSPKLRFRLQLSDMATIRTIDCNFLSQRRDSTVAANESLLI